MKIVLWKPFAADAVPPLRVRRRRKPEAGPGPITITAYIKDW